MIGAASRTMARNDVTVKLDAGVAREAKIVAASRGITVAELVSEILRPIIHQMLREEMPKMVDDRPAPKKPKG